MSEPPEAYVLIHGAHHGAWIWDPLLEHLELPALAVDLPHRGDTGGLRNLTIAGCAESAIADIRAARFGRVIVVGHSLAGSIAYTIAAQEPDLVAGLVGIAAVLPLPGHRAIVDLWPRGVRWIPTTRLRLRPGGLKAPIRINEQNARRRLANDLDAAVMFASVDPYWDNKQANPTGADEFGSWGLVTHGGLRKPAWWAFDLFGEVGPD
ncbi:MAG: alpha/beta fold hydrolase, partial [Acidimicrobiales bacterium]